MSNENTAPLPPYAYTSPEAFLLRLDEDFIRAAYQTMLGRSAEAEELRGNLAALKSDTSRAQLLLYMGHSVEYQTTGAVLAGLTDDFANTSPEEALLQTNDAFVTFLYSVVLGRAPDAGGFEHHINRLESGDQRWDVLSVFLQSEEALRAKIILIDNLAPTHPSGPAGSAEAFLLRLDEDFIRAAYRDRLGRDVDEEGFATNVRLLKDGMTRSAFLEKLNQSSEFEQYRASEPDDLNDYQLAPENAVLRHDSAFTVALNDIVPRFQGDPDFARRSLALLREGKSRWELLAASMQPNRFGQDETPQTPHLRSAEEFLLQSDEAFVRGTYCAVLGRQVDEQGLLANTVLLRDGTSRRAIFDGLCCSPEAQAHGPAMPNFAEGRDWLCLERIILRDNKTFVVALFVVLLDRWPGAEEFEMHLAHLSADGSRWALVDACLQSDERRKRAEPPPVVAASVTFVPVIKTEGPSVFLLIAETASVNEVASDFVRRFTRAWSDHGHSVQIVFWNSDARTLLLASWGELDRLGLLNGLDRRRSIHSDDGEPRAVIDRSSCGDGDWLLCLEPFRIAIEDRRLSEMDAIMQARMLRLRCAFIFHGADPLRSKASAGSQSEAHEQYMQAMLLADAVMPVSLLAADDLTGFFVQHQRASALPVIKKIGLATEVRGGDDGGKWSDYVRTVRGLLTDVGDPSRNLEFLYYLIESVPASGTAKALFASRLANVLLNRGLGLIPVAWDAVGQRLIICEDKSGDSGSADDGQGLHMRFIDSTHTKGPRWILVPTTSDPHLLNDVATFAATHQIRIAAVLHDATGIGDEDVAFSATRTAYFEQLARLEKVFALSESSYSAFYTFLLSWRGKVHSAEHRFKVILEPNEIPGRSRTMQVKRPAPGTVRMLVRLGSGEAENVITAVDLAIRRSSDRLVVTIYTRLKDVSGSDRAIIKDFMETDPKVHWEEDIDDDRTNQLMDEADFLVVPSFRGNEFPDIMTGLWHALPCLVHRDPTEASAAVRTGMVFVDMRDADAFAAAIVKLANTSWRRVVAAEAIAQPIRSWDAYARALCIELSTDRPTDGLIVPLSRPSRDIYTTMPNLRKRPRLSLCISTYNRAGWLKVNLRNIFGQILDQRDDLEVLVVDNTSPDDTSQIVQPYLGRRDFRYHRNPVNVGMLGNLAVTAQKARGEYIWIIGDDDLTLPGVIEKILTLLEDRPELRLIYMNYGYTAENNPASVTDLDAFLRQYNILEPACSDEQATVSQLAAKTENFYTAIWSHVYKRDDAIRSYCQDTSGRIFSTMASCIPTTLYVLTYLSDATAYWIGEPSLVVNSNVSWVDYAPLFELEQFPRGWDLAERFGSIPAEIDRRRSERLWMIEMMWKTIFENDNVGNSTYVSAPRVLMRLKHLDAMDNHVSGFMNVYRDAYMRRHPAATMSPRDLFSAFHFEWDERL